MTYSLNSLKEGYIGDSIGDYYGVTQGDTRSLDCSSIYLCRRDDKENLGNY